jgi:hypothetical protein
MFKKKKKKRIRKKQAAQKSDLADPLRGKISPSKTVVDISDYLYYRKFASGEPWQIHHPNNEIWERAWIADVCRQPLSTQAVRFLEPRYVRAQFAGAQKLPPAPRLFAVVPRVLRPRFDFAGAA